MELRTKIARTIAGLYNNSSPLGLGVLSFVPGQMKPEDAAALADVAIREGRLYLDYLWGRVIKVGFRSDGSTDGLHLYDRDNGIGSGERAIEDGLSDPFYAELDEPAEATAAQ